MDSDDAIPSCSGQNNRRRSLFDFGNGDSNSEEPKIINGPIYPKEYIQKVKTEIDEWKQHLENIDVDRNNHLQMRKMWRRKILDETILTSEQLDFLGSVSFDNYMAEGTKFLKRAAIFFELNLNKDLNDTIEQRLMDVQEKIINDVFKDVNKTQQ